MARRVVKVNTNPNKTPAPGIRNATLHYSELNAMNEEYEKRLAEDEGKKYKKPDKKTVKIDSNPARGGTTRIGPLARGGGGVGGAFGRRPNL